MPYFFVPLPDKPKNISIMEKNIEETARELTSLVAGRIYNLNFNIREVENSLRVRHGVLSHAKNKP